MSYRLRVGCQQTNLLPCMVKAINGGHRRAGDNGAAKRRWTGMRQTLTSEKKGQGLLASITMVNCCSSKPDFFVKAILLRLSAFWNEITGFGATSRKIRSSKRCQSTSLVRLIHVLAWTRRTQRMLQHDSQNAWTICLIG